MILDFEKRVNTLFLEEFLKKSYKKSLSKKEKEIILDFKAVEWFEPFALSLLILWISELSDRNKTIIVNCPSQEPLAQEKMRDVYLDKVVKRTRAFSFLKRSLFLDFLLDRKIVVNITSADHSLKMPSKDEDINLLPLVFFSIADDFYHFIEKLTPKQLQLSLDENTDFEVIDSGEMKEIIMQELGQNIFDHAKGKYGHLFVALRKALDKNDGTAQAVVDARIISAHRTEKRFFEKLGYNSYLSIIISDKGPGIFNTLKESYLADEVLSKKSEQPEEIEILDYAFLQHSTKKTKLERLGVLSEVIKKLNLGDNIPATGLFWVKEVVQAYRGLLTIRSGHSMLSYDFLTYPENGLSPNFVLRDKSNKDLMTLENFGGTQIKIIFPSGIKGTRRKYIYRNNTHLKKLSRNYEYAPINKFLTSDISNYEEKYANWIVNLTEDLHKLRNKYKEPLTIIVDLSFWNSLDKVSAKALYILLVDFMRLQDEKLSILLFNPKNGLFDQISSLLSKNLQYKSGIIKERPILIFDKDFSFSVCGLTGKESEYFRVILDSINNDNTVLPEDFPSLLKSKLSHLLYMEEIDSKYKCDFLFERSEIINTIRTNYKTLIKSIIEDPQNGIFFPDNCFLIPAGAYSIGYFDLNQMYINNVWMDYIFDWLLYTINKYQPTTIVTIGKSLGSTGERISRQKKINHINVIEPQNPAIGFKFALLSSTEKVMILFDVIGTQNSLNNILEWCRSLNINVILTIVDARSEKIKNDSEIIYKNRTYELESILRKPLEFFVEDKPPAFTYEDVIRIDPKSKSPIFELHSVEGIWKQISAKGENEYINEVLKDSNGIIIGHFENNRRHILYLFLLRSIASFYKDIISRVIKNDIEKHWSVDLKKQPISHIIYPSHTPGAEIIAFHISTNVYCDSVSYNPFLKNKKLSEKFNAVIIFDDASATGSTALDMIDFAEMNEAKHIFLYVLCNRASKDLTRRLLKIKEYGKSKVHVRYLSELSIPTFSDFDCPICKSISDLEALREELSQNDLFKTVINERINTLQARPVNLITSETMLGPYLSRPLEDRLIMTEFRSKLELAKENLLIKKSIAEKLQDFSLGKTENKKEILLLFEVISFEAEHLFNDKVIFNDVFYDSFRKAIVETCKQLIGSAQTLSDRDLMNIFTVLRIFDSNILIEQILNIPKVELSKKIKYSIALEILLSKETGTRALYIPFLEEWFEEKELNLKDLINLRVKIDTSPHAEETVDIYRNLCRKLSDSYHLANLFAGLEIDNFAKSDFSMAVDLIENYWKPIFNYIADEIVPALDYLIKARVVKGNKRIKDKINELLYTSNTLSQTIIDTNTTNEEKINSCDSFKNTTMELKTTLLEDSPDSIPQILLSLRTELRGVIRKVIHLHAEKILAAEISIEYNLSDDAIFVFGHESDIFTVINNLIDNVLQRAFVGKINNKLVLTSLQEENHTVSLNIYDSGIGLPENFKFGDGLNTVSEVCFNIGHSWGITSNNVPSPYTTNAKISFYRLYLGRIK